MLASFNIIMDRITLSRLAGDPADVLSLPTVGHIALLLDFDKADDLIQRGREAVDEAMSFFEKVIMHLA